MSGYDDAIAAITSTNFGLVALWMTRAVGIPDWLIKERVASGVLIRCELGVYRLRGVPYTRELRWMAAVLAGGPGTALSHRAAAAHDGFAIRRVRPEITVPHRQKLVLRDGDLHRTRRPLEIVVVRGIPTTARPRTLLDCAGVMPFSTFEPMLQDAVVRKLVKVESLLAIVDRRGGKGVEGTAALRMGLEGGLVDEKLESKLELVVARVLDTARVPRAERQHPLTCADGREVRLDFAWPDRRIAVEANGLRWHGNASQAQKTRARMRSITATGWDVYDYGWYEATETPDDLRAEVEAAYWGTSSGLCPPEVPQNEEDAA
jgi:very-short-patch-repair endonuclease